MTQRSSKQDWNWHMRENACNWLLGSSRSCLHSNALLLFGNPYLFQREALLRRLDRAEPVGQFTNAVYKGRPVTVCFPVFGAPMAAMYAEVMIDNGVRNIIACGYAGGMVPAAEIGAYGLVAWATGLDGTSSGYGMAHTVLRPAWGLVDALCEELDAEKVRFLQGALASIDTLMLEDDRMIAALRSKGFAFIDLETACLFAVAKARNARAAALHVVSDNPTCKTIDREGAHMDRFDGQLRIALSALASLR